MKTEAHAQCHFHDTSRNHPLLNEIVILLGRSQKSAWARCFFGIHLVGNKTRLKRLTIGSRVKQTIARHKILLRAVREGIWMFLELSQEGSPEFRIVFRQLFETSW